MGVNGLRDGNCLCLLHSQGKHREDGHRVQGRDQGVVHTRDAGSVWVRADIHPGTVTVSAEPQRFLFLVTFQERMSPGNDSVRVLLLPEITDRSG